MKRYLLPALAGLALVLAAGCSTVDRESRELIDKGQFGEGLARLEQSMRDSPGDSERRIRYVRARDQVVARLLAVGGAEYAANRLDAALGAFRQVLAIDAGNARAQAGVNAVDAARRHQVLIGEAREKIAKGEYDAADLMVRSILAESPGHPPARELERALREQERKRALAVPALKSRLQGPVNLEFREAPLRSVMEALARSAGINFILDREIRADLRITIFVRDVRVEDALDLIIQTNQLEKKVLTENTVLIYPATPQKLRENQELVMRAFQLGYADAKQTLNLLRTILKSKDVFVDDRTNMIIMRDTPDAIRAAERLISAQDRPDPEVELELEILEVSRSRIRDVGVTLPTSLTGPTGSLTKILDINRDLITPNTGFALKFDRTDDDTKTLANPRIRVRNREKSRVHVGDRVPVISSTIVGTTATGTGGTATSTPVTTEQIQYIDVGIKIEAEPLIHADDTVAVKINLDVSTLGAKTVTNAGTTAYSVGTRNAATVLTLRDGETQALMGLIRDDELLSGKGLPYIGEFPVLDRIFGSKSQEHRNRELVLLVTPRLVRGVEAPDVSASEFWSGTEAAVRVRTPFVTPVPESARGQRPAGGGGAVSGPGASAGPATGPGVVAAPGVSGGQAPAQPASAAPATLKLSWKGPGPRRVGEEFVVSLDARSDGPLKGASLQLRYDPEQFEVLAADNGGYFDEAGGAAVFTPRVEPGLGTVFATLGASGAGSSQGEGSLLKLRMKAKRAGADLALRIGAAVGVDPGNRSVPIEGMLPLVLTIQP